MFEGTDFYAVPDPLPGGPPGTLLRCQPVAAADGSIAGAVVWRIMYLSRSLQGEPIAVTGVALVPTSEPPVGGRPLVTMGHGTAGIADRCAPSRQADVVAALVQRCCPPHEPVRAGYLVVVSDYEGLGTPGRHPYLVGESEGRSMLDAAKAARQLPDADAQDRLAVFGYSQGGHAALWAQQIAAEWAPRLEVVGTVAGAPVTELPAIYAALGSLSDAKLLLRIVAGFHAAYPDADPASVLNEDGLAALPQVDTLCDGEIGADLGLRNADLLRTDYLTAEPWSSLVARSDPGQTATSTPILLLHSADDETVPVELSGLLYDRLRAVGQRVERRVYDRGEGHAAAAPAAVADAIAWFATCGSAVGHSTAPDPPNASRPA
ncbi:MAG: lipase family protein [Acidimicrobiales bacterium]